MKASPVVQTRFSKISSSSMTPSYLVLLSVIALFALGSASPLDSGLGYVYSSVSEHESILYIVVDGDYIRQVTVENALSTVKPAELVLRQSTNGRLLVQAVLDTEGDYKDCDITDDWGQIDGFVLSFPDVDAFVKRAELRDPGDGSMAYSYRVEAGSEVTLRWITNMEMLPDVVRRVAGVYNATRECRELHRINPGGGEQTENVLLDDSSLLEHHASSRSRRSLMMYPGTLWCGVDNNAHNQYELGLHSQTDSCCRTHDHCDVKIVSFSTDYYLLNYRFHTISHCGCDASFRRCLEKTNSPAADTIGRIYFNILQMKCFNLEKRLQCTSRSWWGRCNKYDMTDTAVAEIPRPWGHQAASVVAPTTTPLPAETETSEPTAEEEASGDHDDDILNETWPLNAI